MKIKGVGRINIDYQFLKENRKDISERVAGI